jgi:hypothetical protein
MSRVVFLLEELSMKTLLEGLLPRLVPDLPFLCVTHEGAAVRAVVVVDDHEPDGGLPSGLELSRSEERNRSKSFQVFLAGVRRVAAAVRSQHG